MAARSNDKKKRLFLEILSRFLQAITGGWYQQPQTVTGPAGPPRPTVPPGTPEPMGENGIEGLTTTARTTSMAAG